MDLESGTLDSLKSVVLKNAKEGIQNGGLTLKGTRNGPVKIRTHNLYTISYRLPNSKRPLHPERAPRDELDDFEEIWLRG